MPLFETWLDLYSSSDQWTDLNLMSLDVINLLDSSIDQCVSNIISNDNLVDLTLDPVSEEPILMHHFTQIGGTLEPRIVALNDFESSASILRFKSAKEVFSVVEEPAEDFSKFQTSKEFENL